MDRLKILPSRRVAFGLVLAALVGWPSFSTADPSPTTQSSSGVTEKARSVRPPDAFRRAGELPPFSEADWTEAAEFIRVHSPRRYEVFELLPDDSPQKRAVRRFMLSRYQNLKDYKASDPDSYDGRLKRLETEDEIFGLAADLRRAEGSKREALRDELRTRVAEMIDLGIAERKVKIGRLEKLLQEERNRLGTYEKGRDVLIEQRMDQEITSPGGPVLPGAPQGTNDVDPSPLDNRVAAGARAQVHP